MLARLKAVLEQELTYSTGCEPTEPTYLQGILPLLRTHRQLQSVIGGVPEGNKRDHNIVRVSSFASKELSWHERRCIVLVVLIGCSLNRDLSLPFFLRAIDPLLSSMISTKNSSLRIVVLRIGILQSLHKAVY